MSGAWPPAWLWTAGYSNTHPGGKVGILKTVLRSPVKPHHSCFLIMEHCGAEYVGELSLDDPTFCQQIFNVLVQHLGELVQEIGDVDLSYTL